MKNIILIFLTIITFSCSTYSQKEIVSNHCVMKDTITEKESYLGANKYTDELNKEGSVKFSVNDSIEHSISKYENEGIITNRIYNKKTNIVKTIDYDYLSKKIMSYSFYYKKGGPNIGKEYHFDSSGKIVKIIDNDDPEHYTICYKDAMTIALKNAGRKYEITNISRGNELVSGARFYFWEVIATKIGTIHYYSDSKRYYIDGKTGKIIKVTKLQISSSDVLTPQKE